MRDDYISDKIRKSVSERAKHRCEYCLIKDDNTYIGCEVDHIISIKHGGENTLDNLAFACFPCNRYKGSDIATIDKDGKIVRLFNPRTDNWNDYFYFENGNVMGRNRIGQGTIKLLKLNTESRVEERVEIQRSE